MDYHHNNYNICNTTPIYVDIPHQRDQIFVHLPNYCLDVNTLIHFLLVLLSYL